MSNIINSELMVKFKDLHGNEFEVILDCPVDQIMLTKSGDAAYVHCQGYDYVRKPNNLERYTVKGIKKMQRITVLNRDVILFVLNNMPENKNLFKASEYTIGEFFSDRFIVRESGFYEFYVVDTQKDLTISDLTLSDVIEIISV